MTRFVDIDTIATCERCGRPIRHGQAYTPGTKPGTFTHRGPCVILQGGRP